MVTFLYALGLLSTLGSLLGIAEFGQVEIYAGVTRTNPYIVAGFIAAALINIGLFWGLAEVIKNLQEINEELSRKDF